MLPTTTSPVLTAMPISSSGSPAPRLRALTDSIASCISQRAGDGAAGVVLARDRRAEERQDGVADELVDGPLVGSDDVGHRPEVVVERGRPRASGGMRSAMPLKPRRSVIRMVTVRRSPPRRSPSGDSSSVETTSSLR